MEIKKEVLAIIQARYNSIRFPGKVAKKINNKTILEILIRRLSKSKYISKIIVACSKSHNDKAIVDICKKLSIDYFIGSENDVLDRFYNAAKKYKEGKETIVRITADCPLIDPKIVDDVVNNFFLNKVDYASNTNPPTFPDGLDVEVFKFNVLKEAHTKAKQSIEREHVTPFIINNKKFKKFNLKNTIDYSSLRLTLDEKEDFILIEKIIKNFKNNLHFTLNNILDFYRKNIKIFSINSYAKRNQGLTLNLGQKMWRRAKKIIPGGTMLFSKNPDLFLPEKWPAYFSKTKGCNIWDLENKKYIDMSLMGVGTNILGYSNSIIDKKVINNLNKGNISTLNSIEEIILAEKLISIHPWADMARFTRAGGEANAVAIRIARAATGKDKIAICGYHGWHDWYLSANLENKKNLNAHLMKNLPIKGVPQNLKNSIEPFLYNDFQNLEKIVSKNDIAAIKMEVQRNEEPKNNFLGKIRELATKKKIILIFDECTTGFRQTYGGLHKYYNVNPDMAIFGKAMGNGYAINAVIGKREVMENAQSTFISSTFWTERIGPTAAIATLDLMEKTKSWETITQIGKKITNAWKKISKNHNLKIKTRGIPALTSFEFDDELNNYFKTFITQEMLKKKIFASNVVYVCTYHSSKVLEKYFGVLDEIFKKIKNCEKNKKNILKLLETEPAMMGLRQSR